MEAAQNGITRTHLAKACIDLIPACPRLTDHIAIGLCSTVSFERGKDDGLTVEFEDLVHARHVDADAASVRLITRM